VSNVQPFRIDLTPEQQKEIKAAFGRTVDAVEFRVEELEERIAPLACAGGDHIREIIITTH
jgi:hypothetical protein